METLDIILTKRLKLLKLSNVASPSSNKLLKVKEYKGGMRESSSVVCVRVGLSPSSYTTPRTVVEEYSGEIPPEPSLGALM